MTREDIQLRLSRQKAHNGELKSSINNYKQDINSKQEKIQHLESELNLSNRRLADLEKQLVELEVEVYEPIYLSNVGKCVYATEHEKYIDNKYIERHNAGEELKKLISEENAKQGWKVDWELDQQKKYFIIGYDYVERDIEVRWDDTFQAQENELYFSKQSLENQEFLDKIKPLWLKWKGIE